MGEEAFVMDFYGILVYTLRASVFALVVCGVYALIQKKRGARLSAGRLAGVFYLAALLEITVIRGGVDWANFFGDLRLAPRWSPFVTTISEFRGGAWQFIYHAGGNMMWFVPLGIMLSRKPVWQALIAGMLFSAAIEALQWVFMTGVTDVDDVILNALGALCGRMIAGLFPARTKPHTDKRDA